LNKRTLGPNLPQCCLNCAKCGELVLGKVTEIVATRCHILRLKCTKLILAEPQTPLGELTVLLQTLYLDVSGPTSEENEGTYRGGEELVEGWEVRERGGRKTKPP